VNFAQKSSRIRFAVLPIAVVAAGISCTRHRQTAPVMLPPPVIVQVPAKTPQQPGPPPPLPPGQSPPATTTPPQATTTAQQVPPPPKKKKGRRRKADENQTAGATQPADTSATQPANAAPAAATTQAAAPAVSPAPKENVPQLGQVLSDSQRRDYEAQIRDALDNAIRNLAGITNRALSPQQQNMKSQVQTFIVQAQEASKTDLVAARSLADRASLLSKDLLDSVH
jgi:hypothetical protein